MASKSFQKILIFLIFLFFLISQEFFAQSSSSSENQVHFTQKISWTADKNAFEYKVEIQNLDSGGTETFTTEENSLVFSKPAGNYRYKVTPIDFLGREGAASDWRNFKITKAVRPEIINLADSVSFKGDSEHDSGKAEIAAELSGVDENSQIELVDEKSQKIINPEFLAEEGKLVAQNISEGTYTLKITNPGGLSAEKSGIKITKDNSEELARKAEEAWLEAERIAKEEAARKAEEERIAEEKRLEEERIAAENAERERIAAEEAKKAAEEAEKARLEVERIAKEEAARKAEEERIAEEKRLEEERIAAENAERERIAAEEAEKARLEAERIAKEEEAARKAEEEARKKLLGGPEFYFGAGYTFPFELVDGTMEEYTGKKFYPLSGTLRTSFIFLKTMPLNFGLGIDASYSRIFGGKDGLSLDGNFLSALGILSVQKPLVRNRLNLELYAGGGIGIFHDLKYTYPSGRESEPLKTWDPAFGGGIALQYLFARHFYAEANVSYVHCLFNDLTFGTLNPSVLVGFKI